MVHVENLIWSLRKGKSGRHVLEHIIIFARFGDASGRRVTTLYVRLPYAMKRETNYGRKIMKTQYDITTNVTSRLLEVFRSLGEPSSD